ncbi:MAG: hypothetical protein ACE149_04770 [Armatimonadota bacterium]
MEQCAQATGVEALKDELAFYERNKPEFLLEHEGKFVLIKDSQLIGVFESAEQAYAEGLDKLGNVPFLIKQVAREEAVESIPALHLGLIRAHS